MDNITADFIGKKARALKFLDRVLDEVDRDGQARVLFNNTGASLVVRKGDAVYLRIQAQKYALIDEIHSYELTHPIVSDEFFAKPCQVQKRT